MAEVRIDTLQKGENNVHVVNIEMLVKNKINDCYVENIDYSVRNT